MTGDPALWLTVAVAGGLGALLRVEWSAFAGRRWSDRRWGTRSVNIIGTLALALLVTSGASTTAVSVLGAGLLGGFTTFSTWMLEADVSPGGRLREIAIQFTPAMALVLVVLA